MTPLYKLTRYQDGTHDIRFFSSSDLDRDGAIREFQGRLPEEASRQPEEVWHEGNRYHCWGEDCLDA